MDKSVKFLHLNICYVLYVLVAVTKNNDNKQGTGQNRDRLSDINK